MSPSSFSARRRRHLLLRGPRRRRDQPTVDPSRGRLVVRVRRRRIGRRRLPAHRRRLLLLLGPPDRGLRRPEAQPAHVPQAYRSSHKSINPTCMQLSETERSMLWMTERDRLHLLLLLTEEE